MELIVNVLKIKWSMTISIFRNFVLQILNYILHIAIEEKTKCQKEKTCEQLCSTGKIKSYARYVYSIMNCIICNSDIDIYCINSADYFAKH